MNKRNRNIKGKLLRYLQMSGILLISAMSGILGGCGFVQEDMPECTPTRTEDSDKVLLRFNMESGAVIRGTRADSEHEEVDSEWPLFEDAVNFRDLGLFIFMGSGDDAPLIAKNTSIADSSDPNEMITGVNGHYTVTMSVERSEIDDRLAEGDSEVQFRLLILANCYSPGTGGNFANLTANLRTNSTAASTFKEVVDQAQNWSFDMSEIYSHSEGDSAASGLWKGYIPMFGTNTFTVGVELLRQSTLGTQIYLGEVNLLRALAKVRVLDNIEKKEGGLPRIVEAHIISSTDIAYSLPARATTYIDGQQVHDNYRLHAASGGIGSTYQYKLGYLPSGTDTRIGYIPEQLIVDAYPVFEIKVNFKEHTDDAGNIVADKQETYLVPMTTYKDQELDFGERILRNHIYTLKVNEARTGFPAEISIDVADWAEETLTLDYTENVAVSNELSWTEGYSSLNAANAYVITQPWHDDQPVQLVGTFGISNPVGAIWTASLITTEGATGAFLFVDSEGNQVETVSGEVDGETLSTIRIVTRDPAPQQRNAALLQVVVSLNGHYMEVPLYTDKKFQIIQNPQ